MTPTKNIAGYALVACVLAASAWIAAVATGSAEANSMEATLATTGESAAAVDRFVEPTPGDYDPHLSRQ
jgi:hypothetical protein